MKTSLIAIALMSAAGAAYAQQQVLFTDNTTSQIFLHDGMTLGSSDLLFTGPGASTENYAGITRGAGNTFFFHSAARPIQDATEAQIFRIEGLLGGGGIATELASDDPVQQPAGMFYNRGNDTIYAINNPGSASSGLAPDRFEGVIGVNATSGTVAEVFEEDPNAPRPRYLAASGITAGLAENEFFITSVNGGAGTQDGMNSVFIRMNIDPNTLQGTVAEAIELTAANTGLAVDLNFTRGIDRITGTNDYLLTDANQQAIYRASFDNNGDFQGLTLVRDGFLSAGGVKYDATDDTIVFYDPGADELYRISIDGSTIETLASGVQVSSFLLIPAPGAAALLGLGGLVAARRRR